MGFSWLWLARATRQISPMVAETEGKIGLPAIGAGDGDLQEREVLPGSQALMVARARGRIVS
jgi:hypothetical protein